MSIDEDLKRLWRGQITAPPPSEKELWEKALKYKHTARKKSLIAILLLLITAVFIICIVHMSKPRLFTTYAGTVLTCIAIFIQMIASGTLLPLLVEPTREDLDTLRYLSQLIQIREKQKFLQTRMLTFYSILLMTGIFLYMVEYVLKMKPIEMILAYGITGSWFAFSWWYLRPRTIRKEAAALNEIIGQLQKIRTQLNQLD